MAQKRKVYCKPFFLRSDVRKILEYLVRCKNGFGVLNPFLQRTKCNTSPFCKTKCCALPKSILASNTIFASGIAFLHHAIKHRN